ncbi:MAG: hypothetical protein EPN82_07075 [Bacteroidetes bacterium]|nr:MAG: hypothetical protein EPN82_07075 [Bacteroidota bacterium]
MFSNKELIELKSILVAQRNIMLTVKMALNEIEKSINSNSVHQQAIVELNSDLDFIEKYVDLLDSTDIEFSDDDISKYYTETNKKYTADIEKLTFENWKQFVRDTTAYNIRNNLNLFSPYDSMLTDEDLKLLKSDNYHKQYQWDKWDYIFVGFAGIIASITDHLFVKIPIDLTAGKYIGQSGSEITKKLRDIHLPDNIQKWLENFSKVPYDVVNDGLEGMAGRTHRMQSLGHDPILGFIFGIIDIYNGSLTGFSYNSKSKLHTLTTKIVSKNQSISLTKAFLLQLGHLLSDVGTKMGIQPPFFTLFQGINFKNKFSPKNRTIGEIARWMYINGYDFRHFLTMGVTPGTIEIILRTYLMIRHYFEKGEIEFKLANNPKYRSMLLSAHSIACLSNAGKVAIYQANPLAINYTEWLALIRYLVPSLKYWVFDKTRLKLEYIEKINENGWSEIIVESNIILNKIISTESNRFELGRTNLL